MTKETPEAANDNDGEGESLATMLEQNAPIAKDNPPPPPEGITAPPQESVNKDAARPVDAKGVAFDPAIHAGPGKFKRDGSWSGKRGRKKGVEAPKTASRVHIPNKPREGAQTSDQTAPPTQGPSPEMAARQMAGLTFMAMTVVGGPEFSPQKVGGIDEAAEMTGVWENYFVAKGGVVDIPPGIALLGGLSIFAARRFQTPKVQARFLGYFIKIKSYFSGAQKRGKANRADKASKSPDAGDGAAKGKAPKKAKLPGGNPEYAGLGGVAA